jgi:glycosyltransferase involved in cell wall biosynthesis
MKLISEKDEGMYDAVVKGLKQVSGDVVAYLNADDFYQPNAFKVLRDLFSNLPRLNWLTGVPTFYNWQGLIIESDWPVIYDNRFIRKGLYNNKALPYIQQESIFFRPRLLDSVEFERLKRFRYAGDAYLWNCFAASCPLFVVSAILSGYRLHSENLAITSGNSYANEMNSISEYTGLTEEEYNYLLFAHLTWWRGSKPVKESNNQRYITWDTDWHCWKADHLDYELDYRLPYAESYLEYIATKPVGYIRNYVDRHLVP